MSRTRFAAVPEPRRHYKGASTITETARVLASAFAVGRPETRDETDGRFRRSEVASGADALYRAIVEQARKPRFYTACGVADTPDGRYDLIVAHMVLVMRRLHRAPAETAAPRPGIVRPDVRRYGPEPA